MAPRTEVSVARADVVAAVVVQPDDPVGLGRLHQQAGAGQSQYPVRAFARRRFLRAGPQWMDVDLELAQLRSS